MAHRSVFSIVSATVLAAVAFGIAPLAGHGEQNAPGSPKAGPQAQTEVFRCVEVDGRPIVRLRTGEEYPVLPLTAEERQRAALEAAQRAKAQDLRDRNSGGRFSAFATPDTVDNRRFHGPIRDQGQRNTCGAFATAAAVEGFYRRVDPVRYRAIAKCGECFESAAKYEAQDSKEVKKGFDALLVRAFPDEEASKRDPMNGLIKAVREYAHLVGRHGQYPALHARREEAECILTTTVSLFALLSNRLE